MERRRKRNNILLLGLIPPTVLALTFLLILLFQSIEVQGSIVEQPDTTYLHDIYHVEEIETKTLNEYVTRMDVNEVIKELGVSSVIPFFNQYTDNSLVSVVIIQEAIEMQVPVNVAFSLAKRESQFDIENVSPKNRNGSRDWGLFQLNDTYYKWDRESFFDVEKNVQAGVAHLEYCMDEMGDLDMALAAYNAGVHGVRTWGIPDTTERHVTIILEYEDEINQAFNDWLEDRS